MKNISFVYFDLAGVVFDYEQGLIKLAERNGHTIDDLNKIFAPYAQPLAKGEMELSQLWKIYREKLQMSEPETFDFTDFWIDNFKPISQTHQLITKLSQHYDIGIITNIYHDIYDKALAKGYIPSIPYKTVIQSCAVHYAKPEKHMYDIAQVAANVAAEKILYIDDTSDFIEIAKGFGWNGVHFKTHDTESSVSEILSFLTADN